MSVDTTIITVVFILLIAYYIHICVLSVLVKNPVVAEERLHTHRYIFMVPCRNEEEVIKVTISRLLEVEYPEKEIIVINDGSTDRTAEVAGEFEETGIVEVVSTVDSGRGKGEALNFGFRHILGKLRREKVTNFEKVIIGIVDADGQPSSNICEDVEPFFYEKEVGAVQGAVRIANADANVIALCQDVEFTGFSQAIQKGRDKLGSVGLGGNGQFARLSALCSLSLENPWNQSLTEDLDIGMRLISAGWRVRFCFTAFVAQQGVEKVQPLIVQRTRWMQGHFGCWRYIPSLLGNRNLPLRTRLDNCAYLFFGITPIVVLLSIILSLFSAIGVITVSNSFADILLKTNFFIFIFMFYFLSFIIAIVFVTFYVRYQKTSFWKLFFVYHVFAIYTLLWIPASVGAVINLARGETSWVKTGRTAVEEFIELRRYPRVEVDIPLKLSGDGSEVEALAKDISASGAGIMFSKGYYTQHAIDLVSTGNTLTITAPASGKEVTGEVVWIAYLGFGHVRAGIQFVEPQTVDLKEDFDYGQPYQYE